MGITLNMTITQLFGDVYLHCLTCLHCSGIVLGFLLRPYNLSLREIKYFSFPGEMLMRMLQMLVLPLIVSSLVTGMWIQHIQCGSITEYGSWFWTCLSWSAFSSYPILKRMFFSAIFKPGIASLDSRASGKMGAWAIVYYMVTTFIAVFIGIIMVIIIKPGKGSRDSPKSTSGSVESVQAADAFLDLIR